ncbi:MAG: hypothetical protein PUE67_06820 [Oscillospiraceae bacterium]|nr:hypothetical protein [Oscillospiraceae bacterium]
MDRREKKPLSPKGRKFNIILTVVALILVVAVGGVTTYSWIEQSTDMNLNLNEGNIKRNPENNDNYYHTVKVGKDIGSEYISLNKYADLADGIKLSQVSSADGKTFYYKKGESYIQLDKNYRGVSYLAFDLNIESTCVEEDTKFYFDLGDDGIIKSVYGGNDQAVANSLRMAITWTIEGTTDTKIFSQQAKTYKPPYSVESVTTESFADYIISNNKSIFTLPCNKTAKVEIAIWLEGEDDSDNNLIKSNTELDVKFQINTNWYNTANKLIYIYDGTTEQFMSNCSTGTYKAYNSKGQVVASDKLINLNTGIKNTAIISDISNVTRVEFEFTKQGTLETHTYTWNATGRNNTNKTEVYYTITDYTKDAE